MLSKKKAKKHMQHLIENSIRIKCSNCTINENCKFRINKEKSEKMGIITYCSMAPKIKRRTKKKRK